MVDFRLKPDYVRRLRLLRRQQMIARYQRVRVFGLVAFAALFLLYRLLHTPSGWLFPRGWWRW